MVNKVKILRLLCGEFRPKLGVCLNSLDLRSMLQLGVLWGVEAHIIGKCLRFYLKVYLWIYLFYNFIPLVFISIFLPVTQFLLL